ncbi:hypothetical protein BDV12DRAFT_198421 [Aspergillus spectabilis]
MAHLLRAFGAVLTVAAIPVLVIYAAPAFTRCLTQGLPPPDNVRIEVKSPTNISVIVDNYMSMASVDLLEPEYGSEERLTIQKQRLKLEDLVSYTHFLKAVASSASSTLGGRAEAPVNLASISTLVDLHKPVVIDGFNAFPSLDILEIKLKPRDENGYNLHAKIAINNPTPTSAALGDVTLDVRVGDIVIGEARTSVAKIIPGENIFDIDAKLNVINLQKNMETIIKIEIPYLRNEEIIASASEAFGSLEVSLTRPVRPLVQSVLKSGILGTFINPIVVRLLDNILAHVKDLDEEDLEHFAASLSDLAGTGLKILSMMSIL